MWFCRDHRQLFNMMEGAAIRILLQIMATVAVLQYTMMQNWYNTNIQTYCAEITQHGMLHTNEGFQSNLKMGRKAMVPLQEAIDVVKEYMNYFTTVKLPEYTSKVWEDMSKTLKNRWSAHNVYTNVRENRRFILSTAREEMGIVVLMDENECLKNKEYDDSRLVDANGNDITYVNEEHDSTFNSSSDANDTENTQKFELILTQEQWNAIKPDPAAISGGRERIVLMPKVWTNIVAIAFWQQHKLNCAYVFKRADIKTSPDGLAYEIAINGKCKSTACGNTFVGRATKSLSNLSGLIIEVTTRDTRQEIHEEVRRPLNGKRRIEAQKELIAEGCSVWRKRKARENMQIGDLVPPFVPSNDVLKRARKDGMNAELNVQPTDARDLIRTIEELTATVEYAGLIQAVGSLPFYVFYGTPAQLHVYNEYCRIMKGASVVSIDATGSIVKKLTRPGDKKTGHIFLYSVVINFENTTIPVHQMLSEKHETEFIQYWLQQWIRMGARKPREAVCDYSRALISAICMAMNNITIKSYIDVCFASVQSTCHSFESLATFIRIDVAHLIHLVCRWKSFKSVRQSAIKDFYVRCVALMIDCQTLPQLTEIFTLTCAVGMQEHEDAEIGLPQAPTTRAARKKLEDYIAIRGFDNEFENRDLEGTEDAFKDFDDSSEDAPNAGRPIEQWVQHQVMQAGKPTGSGVELNPFYLPDFIQQLSRLAKEFPVWTSVTLPYEAPHATSSYVEGYFNDLKTRVFKDYSRLMRPDIYLKKHALDINGGTLLFSSKLKSFEKRGGLVPIWQLKEFKTNDPVVIKPPLIQYNAAANDSDLNSWEDWMGKATAPIMIRDDESIESLQIDSTAMLTGNNSNSNVDDTFETVLGLLPTSVEILDKISIENILLDHSYTNKTCENTAITSPKTSKDNIDLNCHPEAPSGCADIHNFDNTDLKETDLTIANIIDNVLTESKPKKKDSKYFKEFPEIRQINILTRKSTKPSLLPNGSLCPRPVKIDKKNYFVQNTCAFDSLASIIMTSAIDDIHYASFLERSGNRTLRFVSTLTNKGVTTSLLGERAIILKPFSQLLSETKTSNRVVSYTINAIDCIANVVCKTLSSEPSVFETLTCSVCSRHQFDKPLMFVNHRIIGKQGFGMLEKALNFRSRTYNVKCYDEPCSASCILDKTPNVHIFIELDVRYTGPGIPSAKKGMECKLEQMPVCLRLPLNENLDAEYRLVGLVRYKEKHFVACCRRKNGTWQKYDDMLREVTNCKLSDSVEPHLAVYIRQYGDKCDSQECPCNSTHRSPLKNMPP